MSPGDTPPSIGRYQLMQVVRHEGATTLHDAFDPELGHQVALITSPVGPDQGAEDRLAFRLRRMRHPNIVSVLDMGRQDEVAFLAAECVATEPLATFAARARPIPFLQGLPLVLQLLSALEHAHARGMAHATIDLEHVQVTPGGQIKLPPGGWSLSTDRQPNLRAAARMAHVLLSGTCAPQVRSALDAVLHRAEGADPEARYPRADDFILALLEAAGYPVRRRAPVMERPLVAEPQPVAVVQRPTPEAAHVPARVPRKPHARRRPGRILVAVASLLAALLVPQFVGDGILHGRRDTPAAGAALPLGAAAPTVAPAPVAVATVAPTPVEPSPVPTAPVQSVQAPPAETTPVQTPPVQAVQAPPSESAAVQTPPVQAVQAPPAQTAPAQTPPVQAARPRAARPAVVAQRAVPAPSPKAPARQVVATRSPMTRTHAAPSHVAPPLTAAAGCPYDVRFARDLCLVQQCSRPELRETPTCKRMAAEQRAALARLRGTPD